MPLLKMKSNESFLNSDELLVEASRLVADALGKPEKYVMVCIEESDEMIFGGNREPMFHCELKSIGLPKNKTKVLSKKISDFLTEKTGVAAERIYIEFTDVERSMWGWNGSTF